MQSQSCAVAKSEQFWRDNQICQREWKTAPWECSHGYENQTLEAFVAASRLFAKYDCPVANQNCSFTVKLAPGCLMWRGLQFHSVTFTDSQLTYSRVDCS